jgi:hypothetical protein
MKNPAKRRNPKLEESIKELTEAQQKSIRKKFFSLPIELQRKYTNNNFIPPNNVYENMYGFGVIEYDINNKLIGAVKVIDKEDMNRIQNPMAFVEPFEYYYLICSFVKKVDELDLYLIKNHIKEHIERNIKFRPLVEIGMIYKEDKSETGDTCIHIKQKYIF